MHTVLYEPRKLPELLRKHRTEYQLSICYVVQLDSVQGSYPIIERTTGHMVAFHDFETAKCVWACMSPAPSHVLSIPVFLQQSERYWFPCL